RPRRRGHGRGLGDPGALPHRRELARRRPPRPARRGMTARAVLTPELIRRKRDGGELEGHEIEWLVRGITDGWVSDAQVGAFAMAVVLKGMTRDERVALTGAMMRSGEVLDWSEAGLAGPALDKHSTGGVGDKVSLLLAPIVAACGGAVPMISGRGLGATGGTLEKIVLVPG